MEEKWIVMVGNPSDGYKIYGVFDTFEDADEWIRHNDAVFMSDTWIMPLNSVSEEDKKETKLSVYIETLVSPWQAEELEDDLAEFLAGENLVGRIEDSVTGNTTIFPIDRNEFDYDCFHEIKTSDHGKILKGE